MSDNTPTERFEPVSPETDAPAKKSRGLLYTLIAIGILLLIGIVVVVVLLIARGNGQPTAAVSPLPSASVPSTSPSTTDAASASPSASGSGSSTPVHTSAAPPPANTKPHFTVFQVPTTESGCGVGPYVSYNPPVKVKWVAVNAVSVWFVQGTSDAVDAQFQKLPLSGNQNDFAPYGPATFPCDHKSATYTLTILGKDGTHHSHSWTVKDTGSY